MKITGKQAHVLENLERVTSRPYKIAVTSPLRWYQLDGRDCTAQITGLVVKQLVTESAGRFLRGPRRAFSVLPENARPCWRETSDTLRATFPNRGTAGS